VLPSLDIYRDSAGDYKGRKRERIAKVATERELLEWTYYIVKGRKTFQ